VLAHEFRMRHAKSSVLRFLLTSAVALAALSGMTASPAAAAPTPQLNPTQTTGLAVKSGPVSPMGWCGNWSNRFSKGHAFGDACLDHVHGWVVDDQADGYCVYVRVYWSDGRTSDSDWACPKGVQREFTFDRLIPGVVWDHISIEAIYVG
jgi:hypothetical protein